MIKPKMLPAPLKDNMTRTKDHKIASEDAQDARRELNKTLVDIVGITTFGYKYRAAKAVKRKAREYEFNSKKEY